MPRRKQTKEEILTKAKLARRERYAKIKSDPIKYALEKEKEHQRYLKRKAEKKLLPIADLTPRARKEQRRKWRVNYRKYYKNKTLKNRGLQLINDNIPGGTDTDNGDESEIRTDQSDADEDPLFEVADNTVPQFLQPSTSNATTDFQSNKASFQFLPERDEQLEILQKKITHLKYSVKKRDKMYQSQIEVLKNKIETYRKIIIRLKKRLQSPNTKVINMIKDKSKVYDVKKKVLFGEAIKKSLKANYNELTSDKEKKYFSDTLLGNKRILKKYKVVTETKNFTVRNKKETTENKDMYEKLKGDIKKFFERDDVSRITAGKKECITEGKQKKQKRYLMDTMKNIHKIFEREFSKVSYSYFCKQRPKWILIPNIKDRDTCLCQIHANIDLLMKALHNKNILEEKDSKELIKSLCCTSNCLLKRCPACIDKKLEYFLNNEEPLWVNKWEYRKETFVYKGKDKEKRIIQKSKRLMIPKDAVEQLENLIPLFLQHEGRRRWQFIAMKDLKEKLKQNEVVVHIDYSENYTMKYAAEVQSCHFDGSLKQLTLHTAVIYFLGENGQVTCKSFCTVSKNLRHDAAAVWAHIVPLLDYIYTVDRNIDTLHFMSDSPSSQYRNKKMFYIISKLHWFYPNLQLVTWNYSEADAAVANGKDIAKIEDFLAVVKENSEKITIKVVEDYDIFEKDLLIPDNVKLLTGTIKVHQVLWRRNEDTLIFREVSCLICFDMFCSHTKFIGKLSYAEEKKLDTSTFKAVLTPVIDSHKSLAHQVQSKTRLLRNIRKPVSTIGKENVLIQSNILVKPATRLDENVTMLPDITPDNKITSSVADVNISDMVNLYNISGISANLSGIFENFVPSKNTYALPCTENSPEDVAIFPNLLPVSISAPKELPPAKNLPGKASLKIRKTTSDSEINFNLRSNTTEFVESVIKNTKYGDSSSDEEIFPYKKKNFFP